MDIPDGVPADLGEDNRNQFLLASISCLIRALFESKDPRTEEIYDKLNAEQQRFDTKGGKDPAVVVLDYLETKYTPLYHWVMRNGPGL